MSNYNSNEDRSSAKAATTVGGCGFTGLLTIAFIVLKLCGVISWSWFWVLSPIIFSIGLCLAVVLLAIAILAVIAVFNARDSKKDIK